MKKYQKLAMTVNARENCRKLGNDEWYDKHTDIIDTIMQDAPSGSGIDCGTKIDLEKSTGDKLIFYASYHHMNDGGMYDGWTEHTIKVMPSLAFDYDLKITGKDRNMIKEYLSQVYDEWLSEDYS